MEITPAPIHTELKGEILMVRKFVAMQVLLIML